MQTRVMEAGIKEDALTGDEGQVDRVMKGRDSSEAGNGVGQLSHIPVSASKNKQ